MGLNSFKREAGAFLPRTEAFPTRAEAALLPRAGIEFPVLSSCYLQDRGGKPAGEKG